ncbi:Gfo/Idh/MocA family protein [Fundicoccus culcitae]|uniref:Gfo/Idh/MocA family oxidoreductase n=1 Tax=Fundicoccus culcitae TaxID=2969821 RepID=A0ABY5P694_9LACT|nr:Gfo/Idh/MocA family oxidoreductase [Fundicoccus culcitae]UUX33900.1 Gfo/Idh/MocA family oxidoreductase [Fundicoccus culcitae]
MTLRVGVIGCGGIGTKKHLPALAQIEEVEIVALCDIIVERAVDAKKEFGTADTEVFADYQEMLDKVDLDVVHVCTPNSSHAELSIAALEADCHVMCEKPMAKTAKEARAMVEAAKRTGKKLTIGYQNRFRTDSQHLHKIVEDGGLGDIYFAKAHAIRRRAVPTWGVFLDEEAQGGGPLIDIGTHALDLTLWLMNNYKPKFVVGNAYHKLAEHKNSANAWGPWDPSKFTVEDSAFGYVVMENGASIFLEASWALNTLDVKEAKTTLMGDKAGADMNNGLTINGEEYGLMYEKEVNLTTGGVDFYEGMENDPELIEARQWIDAILNDTTPVVLPEQALVVTEILEAIYESSKTGKPVYFNGEGEA